MVVGEEHDAITVRNALRLKTGCETIDTLAQLRPAERYIV
ncbi:hypothetical protein OUHCRE3_12540 [Enterobacter hormaechei]